MRRAALVTLVCLASAYPATQGLTTTPSAVIGHVFDARDQAALRRARVTLSAAGSQPVEVFTDDDGQFVLPHTGVSPLMLRIAKARYATVEASLALPRDGRPLRVLLSRSAAVMGRVVDEAGRPATRLLQRPISARLLTESATLQPSAPLNVTATPDRLGDYRLGGLAAGRYEISLAQAGIPSVVVTLAAGDEVTGVDFIVPGAPSGCTGILDTGLPPAASARISGRVLTTAGQPIPCATVRVEGADAQQVNADRQGRYTLAGLKPGTFSLLAAGFSHRTLRYGQRRPEDEDTPIDVAAGERREIDVTLARDAVITGTVTDEHGEPLEGVEVTAVHVRSVQQRDVANSALARTDDRGYYRLLSAQPGIYAIGARPPGEISQVERGRGYASSYHPGTTNIHAARPITLEFGRDVPGADIVLTPVFTGTISGIVLDPSGQPPATGLRVNARPRAASLDAYSAAVGPGGRFELRNVPRGDYVLTTSAAGGLVRVPFALAYVSVVDDRAPSIVLRLTDGATIDGRLIIEIAPEINRAGLEVTAASADRDYMPAASLRTPFFRGLDDTFSKTGLVGPVRLALPRMPACDTCYLKAARINGMDAADRPFDFGVGGGIYRGVEVVISDAGATIEGRIVDSRGRNVPEGSLIVLPIHEDLRFPGSRHVRRATASNDGLFRAMALPPGDYIVAALNYRSFNEADVLDDRALIELLVAGGQRVTLVERERRMLTLRPLRR